MTEKDTITTGKNAIGKYNRRTYKMKKKLLASMLAAAIAASALTGCGITDSNHTEKGSAKTVKLDPQDPALLTR